MDLATLNRIGQNGGLIPSDLRNNLQAPADGQPALTAHDNGDGTWSVTRGDEQIQTGLSQEEAIAIVGAPTGPYRPANEAERIAGQAREAVEKQAEGKEEARAEAVSDATVASLQPTLRVTVTQAEQPTTDSLPPNIEGQGTKSSTSTAGGQGGKGKPRNGGEPQAAA